MDEYEVQIMARLPIISRIVKADLPEATEPWIDRLLYAINTFFETVTTALNKKLILTENIVSQVVTFNITAGAASTTNIFRFTATLPTRPQALLLMKVTAFDGSTIGNAVYVDWELTGNDVLIHAITGLT